MWNEVATQPDPWQLGWEALAAIGTLAAVLFALWSSLRESRVRKRESLARSGRNVQVRHHVYDDHELVAWHIENNSTATIFGFRYSLDIEDIYGPVVQTEKYSAEHLTPGGVRDIALGFNEIPTEMYLTFMDGNGVSWRAMHAHEGMEAGDLYTLERVTPFDDTLPARLRRLLRASRASLRRLLHRFNLEGFEGLLILVILALIGYIIWA